MSDDDLRRVFAAVAAATPVADRRAELLAALDERERRPRRWLLLPVAAAAVVVIAVLVGVRGGDHLSTERTGPPAPSTTTTVPGPYDDSALDTGWYLPGPGWTVTGVQIDHLDVGEGVGCPCLAWAAAQPGGDPAVLDVAEADVPDDPHIPPTSTTTAADVGGRDGTWVDHEDGRRWLWVDVGRRRIAVASHRVPAAVVIALADAWADAVEAGRDVDATALPLPDGYVSTGVQQKAGRFEHLVAVTAEEEGTGRVVEYQLVPTGWNRDLLMLADHVADADGSLLASGAATDEAAGRDVPVVGSIGGPADLVAGPRAFGGPASELDRDELTAFFDGLREVDATTWRAALPSGDGAPEEVRTAPTLFDPPLTG